jgi:NDMA-dependent alcohol dehydrogenase
LPLPEFIPERAMARTGKAVVCRELNKPVVVETIAVDSPKRGEVMVKLAACGVCHSDLSAVNGTIPLPPPIVLGHEGAGEIVEVGEGVSTLAVGDHVVTSFVYMCGKCSFCSAGRPVLCVEQGKALVTPPEGTPRVKDQAGKPLNIFSGCGVMAEYATLSVDNVVKIDSKIPLDRAALVGCAVTTGVGAVFNTARVEPGATVVVFGCGGVGLNAIQGAAIAGAEKILAVDTMASKLEMAKKFGATDTLVITPGQDATKEIKKLTGGGPDYAFECVGSGALAELAYKSIRRGGKAVIVGVARASDAASFKPMGMVFEEKSIQGSYFGSCVPRVDFPRMLQLYMAGRLKLDELITRRYKIDEAPQAFADLESGKNARGVIVF